MSVYKLGHRSLPLRSAPDQAIRRPNWGGFLVQTLMIWHRRVQTRYFLASCEDYVLRDIGLERWQAEAEARKPFWRR